MVLQRSDQRAGRLAVFGLGFCGTALTEQARAAGWTVHGYSRGRGLHGGRPLDAADPADCRVLASELVPGSYDALVVTFAPEVAHAEFWPLIRMLAPRPLLLGTTGVYLRESASAGSTIREDSPVDPAHPRAAFEADFLDHGGIVVRLAGLYGGRRNPARWIVDGRVGYEDRQVNLVHRDDVAAALLRILTEPRVDSLYNLSDGQLHTWRQIIDELVEQDLIEHDRQPLPLRKPSVVVDNRHFLRDFPDFRFHDFWEEIGWLARELV